VVERIFDGAFEHGELKFLPNQLVGEGAETVLHFHNHPHVLLAYPGKPGEEIEYELYAIVNGEEVLVPMDPWGFRYVEANVEHKFRLKKGSYGRFVCFFCRYNRDGTLRAEPHGGS